MYRNYEEYMASTLGYKPKNIPNTYLQTQQHEIENILNNNIPSARKSEQMKRPPRFKKF